MLSCTCTLDYKNVNFSLPITGDLRADRNINERVLVFLAAL